LEQLAEFLDVTPRAVGVSPYGRRRRHARPRSGVIVAPPVATDA